MPLFFVIFGFRGGGVVLKALDLFAGAVGGWTCGMHRAGFTTIAACEIDPWRQAVFAANNPSVVLFDDIRGLHATDIVARCGCLPDIIVGSPPCQDISTANTKGKGVDGEQSGLFFEAIRLIGECRPRWVALENSSNLRTRGADRVLGELEALGYTCWPLVVGADDVGANHRRKRVWIVACDAASIRCDGRRPAEAPGRPRPEPARHDVGASALRDIGLAWPHWNGGLAGLAASCIAAGARDVDDGRPSLMAPGVRNRAIAACGDTVVETIPYLIGRAILFACRMTT